MSRNSTQSRQWWTPVLVVILLVACNQTDRGSRAPEETIPVKKIESICIWDGLSLREEPTSKGRWLSAISLGETVFWLEKSSIDSNDNNREYMKIELSDSTVGWVSAYGIVPNARVGAVVDEAPVYRRPDLLTMTDKTFDFMDMIAITEEKDGWVKVVGEKREKRGWIQEERTTTDIIEVTVAILAKKELTASEEDSRRETIESIIRTSPYPQSHIVSRLKRMIGVETVE